MLLNMMSDLGHGLADIRVGGKQLVVLAGLPISESGQFLGDSLEESDDDTDRSRFHVVAELVNSRDILRSRRLVISFVKNMAGTYWNTVMAVKLHFLPNSKENCSQNEDSRPVLKPITTVHTGVKSRELLKNVLLQLTPHVGHGTFDLEVDHDGRHCLSSESRTLALNLAQKVFVLANAFNHGHTESKVVGKDQLQSLADDR